MNPITLTPFSAKPGNEAKKFKDKFELMQDPVFNQAYTEAWAVVRQMAGEVPF